MKTKLLLLILIITSTFCIAQIPTSGLLAEYEFTNGSLADPYNGDDFTKTGTMSSTVVDRFGSANDAFFLNQDYLTRPNINYAFGVTYSFWIKTSTIDAGQRTITDDLSTSAINTGVKIYLEDGKIGVRGVHYQSPTGGPNGVHGFYFLSSKIVADGEWHHIVGTIQETNNTIEVEIFVDTISESFVDVGGSHAGQGVSVPKSTGNVTISNNRPNNLPNTERYLDVLDDLYIYNRRITPAEVTQIGENGGFCFPPEISTVTISNTLETTLDIAFADPGTYDVAFVKIGEPFANATIVNVIDSGIANTISNLDSSTIYEVYVRKECSATLNSVWSKSTEIRTKGKMFVNPLATGANNGTSWADAFIDLQYALSLQETDQAYWVIAGRYIPDVSNRYITFNIAEDGVKIYGGFNGTETQLSERDFTTNETIFSGDILNNDTTVSFTTSSRSDNSNRVINVRANNFLLDGVIVSDGHASAGVFDGAGIGKDGNYGFNTGLKIENCVFKDNVAYNGGAGIRAEFKKNGAIDSFDIINCKFDNNLSRYGASMYVNTNALLNTLDFNVYNSIFSNNLCTDRDATPGHIGSAGWIRPAGNNTLNATFINNTYSNNKDDGTTTGFSNANRGTLALSESGGGTMNVAIHNAVFWENKIRGTNTIAKALSGWTTGLPANLVITNSIDEDDFSNVLVGAKTNTINTNPFFVDGLNGDYTLQATSPAIDSGNNSIIPVTLTTDLLGNQRIFNATVDMGAYEFGSSTLGINTFQLSENQIKLYPNPTTSVLNIKMKGNLKQATVYSVLGAKVLVTTSKSLNTAHLKSGLYLITIEDETGSVTTKRFIKQ